MFEFSREFNAAITYFADNDEVYEIQEHQYFAPAIIAVGRKEGYSFILYNVDQARDIIHPSIPPKNYDRSKKTLNLIALKATEALGIDNIGPDLRDRLDLIARRIRRNASGLWTFVDAYRSR